MRAAAAMAGIDLVPVSSFRDFERQRAIWNAKFRGEKPLLDRQGGELDALQMSAAERVEAIMWWSAIPGASRHHWGTDIDVIDRAALPAGAAISLLSADFAESGPFVRLELWLRENMQHFGFFRPYESLRAGVSPEPWHLSYAPLALRCSTALTVDVLRDALESAPIDGSDILLEQLAQLHARFVLDVDSPR